MNNEKAQIVVTEPIRVSIFNQVYSLRSHDDQERVKHLAQFVDERMRQIALLAPNHDVVKIAVLAALNIADDFQRMKELYEKEQSSKLQAVEGHQEPPRDVETNQQESKQQSWYEDLFDSGTAARKNDERLSSLISSKLQMLRQPNQDSLTIEAEEEGD